MFCMNYTKVGDILMLLYDTVQNDKMVHVKLNNMFKSNSQLRVTFKNYTSEKVIMQERRVLNSTWNRN